MWSLTSCKSPPTAFERKFFDIQTNYVPIFVLTTNTIQLTNTFIQFQTNQIGQIVLHTNELIIPVHSLVTVTQIHEQYDLTVKDSTKTGASVAGAGANLVIPGSGGAVAGILIGLAGAWAKLRSSKKTNVALAQNVETALEFIETVPGGSKYTSAIKQFMQKDQAEQGVEKGVKAARAEVDNLKAKASVGAIDATIKNFSGVDRTKATG